MTIMELLQQLNPFWGVVIAFLVWMQYRTQVRLREKDVVLENVQSQQIKTQSDADEAKARAEQQKAQIEIIKEFAAGVPKNQESWQSVLNTMSARRLEGDKAIAEALREIATSNRENIKAIDGIASIIEIHTTAYGTLRTKVEDSLHTFVASAAATHKAVDSQKEELQLVNMSIGTLTIRLDDLIEIDETHVLDEDTRHKEQKAELVAIKNALQTNNAILAKILKSTEGTTQPLPAPETWDEDTEATANIPPRKLEDADGNPTPNVT